MCDPDLVAQEKRRAPFSTAGENATRDANERWQDEEGRDVDISGETASTLGEGISLAQSRDTLMLSTTVHRLTTGVQVAASVLPTPLMASMHGAWVWRRAARTPTLLCFAPAPESCHILYGKSFDSKLSGNEVYYTAYLHE